jgi:hypothetical protein
MARIGLFTHDFQDIANGSVLENSLWTYQVNKGGQVEEIDEHFQESMSNIIHSQRQRVLAYLFKLKLLAVYAT